MPDYEALAAIHAASFTHPRPWSAAELQALAEAPGGFLHALPHGFVLGRVVLDEVELLTIAVAPDARRKGAGARLLSAFHSEAAALGAVSAFLEVAADNAAAQALYLGAGWQIAGRRRDYYTRSDGITIDAQVMTRPLP